MSETNEALIARLRKLMAMTTERGATEAEAEAAACKVQELLARHNLSMAQVAASRGDTAAPQFAARVKTASNMSAMYEYQRSIMKALARNNFCMYFLNEAEAWSNGKLRKVKRHVLLGSEVNVTVTLLTYEYLVTTLDRLLPYTGMEKRGKQALKWLAGGADRLVERLDARRRDLERQTREEAATQRHPGAVPGNAVVLADVYSTEEDLNNDALNGWELGTTARRRKEDAARYAAARAAREAKQLKLREEYPDLDAYVIELMSFGWSLQEACDYYAKKNAPKSEAEQRKEEERRRKQEERWQRKWERDQEKWREKFYDPDYQAGREAAEDIGLDQQVGYDKARRTG